MAKVDWINWKTDVDEIINPDKLIEKYEVLSQDYKSYINPVIYENIKFELKYGGLDKSSLNLMGTAPANEIALRILNNLDEINEIIGELKVKIENDSLEQRKIEKEQLINKIKEKIEKESLKLNIMRKNNENDLITSQEEYIRHLNDRLEIAKGI